jgi:hypothetical protein
MSRVFLKKFVQTAVAVWLSLFLLVAWVNLLNFERVELTQF